LKGGFFKRGNKYHIFMSKITEYLKETKSELKHVLWPTRTQALYYTIIVVVLSVLVAYFLGIFDFIFSKGLEKLISL
jgi:preprotein translocase SecE subunit